VYQTITDLSTLFCVFLDLIAKPSSYGAICSADYTLYEVNNSPTQDFASGLCDIGEG
jgi:hypothetical protein